MYSSSFLQLAQPCGGETRPQDASDPRLPGTLQPRPAHRLSRLQPQPLQPCQRQLHPAHPPQALKRAIGLTAPPPLRPYPPPPPSLYKSSCNKVATPELRKHNRNMHKRLDLYLRCMVLLSCQTGILITLGCDVH